jgi:hypothetical protein
VHRDRFLLIHNLLHALHLLDLRKIQVSNWINGTPHFTSP